MKKLDVNLGSFSNSPSNSFSNFPLNPPLGSPSDHRTCSLRHSSVNPSEEPADDLILTCVIHDTSKNNDLKWLITIDY